MSSHVCVRLMLCALALGAAQSRGAVTAFDSSIVCVHIDPNDASDLPPGAAKAGLQVVAGKGVGSIDHAGVVLWEATGSSDIDEAQAQQIGEYVRGGGNLILTLDEHPGKGPFRMRFMLPTTAWRSTMYFGLQFARSTRGVDWDPAMFAKPPEKTPEVPYFFGLRPFDTVERGQGRHEPLDQTSITLSGSKYGGDYKAWDPTFTRPLLDRDWQIRARTDDLGASALLITGRYGAGSVAVFASSARFVGSGVWTPLLTWMKENQSVAASAPITTDQITSTASVDVAGRSINFDLTNHSADAVKVELIARMLTWENALIGDANRHVQLPAGKMTRVTIPLPAVDEKSYQALQFKDAFIVRSGVLSEDGRQIVCEQRTTADLRPPTVARVMLDNLHAVPYPFNGPGYGGLSQMNEHMGMPVMAYAYPPDAVVSGTVHIDNGLRNIAPLASVKDETQPENPSIGAINDESANAEKIEREDLHAYGWWMGAADADNSLLFTFPESVRVNQVVLNGNPDDIRHRDLRNPGEVIVETDSGQVADLKGLDALFKSGFGLVHVPFPAAKTKQIRVRFPNVPTESGPRREAPCLGEIEIIGWQGDVPAAVNGKLTVSLVDAMHQSKTTLAEQQMKLDPEQSSDIPFHFSAAKVPDGETGLYRVEANFIPDGGGAAIADAAPFMVLQPPHPLHSLHEIRPPGHVEIGFIVTRGFRSTSPIGSGTQETVGSWGSPDDFVYAYEHLLKQTGKRSSSSADRLFASEVNFSHYAAPWSLFPNGEVFFDVAAPHLVDVAKKDGLWKSTDTVALGFSDRWDTGPSGNNLYSWQELVEFDNYLASQHLPRLKGKTREELTQEISSKYDARWSAWQMARYAGSVKTLRDAFAKEMKKLVISGQGMPLVPLKYLADLTQTIMGFSDDTTWGMWGENIPATTGREMALLAFNPDWKMSEVFVPGYDSSAISTRFWGVIGTTESTRRHYFDAGWRGLISSDGTYRSMHTYGFNMNGENGYCMSLNDWQETWRLEERLSLLSPEGPLGCGVIVSNAAWDDPDHTTYSGGGMGGSEGDENINHAAKAIGAFSEVGIPISFSSNWTALSKWSSRKSSGSAPLILLGLTELSPSEIEILSSLHQRGVRMVAISGEGDIPPAVAEIFGIGTDGLPTTGKEIGKCQNAPVVATDQTLLIRGDFKDINTADLRRLLPAIQQALAPDLQLPAGTGGYGFTMGRQRFVVLEDWREEARDLEVRLKVKEGEQQPAAVNMDDHLPLKVTRDGDDWIIHTPTRPGDGTLICVE